MKRKIILTDKTILTYGSTAQIARVFYDEAMSNGILPPNYTVENFRTLLNNALRKKDGYFVSVNSLNGKISKWLIEKKMAELITIH